MEMTASQIMWLKSVPVLIVSYGFQEIKWL